MSLEKTLLNSFEMYYKEYKEYSNFFEDNKAKVMSTMKDKVKELMKTPDDLEKATKFVLETQSMPMLYAIDLNLLKESVLVAYQVCKDVVEIPSEVKQELEELKEKKTKQMYTVKKGVAEELSSELIKQYKDRVTPEAIQEILKRFKNIKDIENL
jgi:RNA-splicing ligase RtcB